MIYSTDCKLNRHGECIPHGGFNHRNIEEERIKLKALVDEAEKAHLEFIKDKRQPNGLLQEKWRLNLHQRALAADFGNAFSNLRDFNQKYKPAKYSPHEAIANHRANPND